MIIAANSQFLIHKYSLTFMKQLTNIIAYQKKNACGRDSENEKNELNTYSYTTSSKILKCYFCHLFLKIINRN